MEEKKSRPIESGSLKLCFNKHKLKQLSLTLKILFKNSHLKKNYQKLARIRFLAAWSGLGFYRRARNIFASKEIIKKEYGNKFPKKFNHIVTLPGIGKSTAGAILSLAYLDPHPILDGNVKRVISRFLNKDSNVLTESQLWKLSSEMINRDDCFSYTQGIMDLGATICTPSKPSCNECPVSSHCLSAFKVSPIKRNKVASTKKVISMNLSLIQTKKSLLLAKNETESIWKNLWLPFKSVSLENHVQDFQLIGTQEIQHELTHRKT